MNRRMLCASLRRSLSRVALAPYGYQFTNLSRVDASRSMLSVKTLLKESEDFPELNIVRAFGIKF